QMQIALVNGQFASGRSGLFLLVALHDMIDADMAPAAFAIIDNLDDDDLADQIANIPGMPIKLLTAAGLIIWPGGGARDFAGEQQVDAGFSRILAAADEEVDECSLNLELLRGESTSAIVAAVVGVRQTFAEKAGYRHLVGQRAARRPGAKCSAGGFPVVIGLALEVGDEDVVSGIERTDLENEQQGRQTKG